MPKFKPTKEEIADLARMEARKVVNSTVETKFKLVNYNQQTIQDSARTPLNIQMLDIGEGDTQNTRTGNQVWLTGLYVQGYLTVADSTNVVRMTVYEKRGDSGDPTWSIASAIDQDDYTVYSDKIFTLVSGANNAVRFIRYKKSFTRKGRARGRRIIYGSSTSTDVKKGNLYVRFVSDSSAISDPTFTGEIRSYFKDP